MKKAKDHIGQKIKRLRAFKGMNQEDLAKAIGKTRSLISHFERSGNINKYTLQEIAAALGVDVESIEQTDISASKQSIEFLEAPFIKNNKCQETIDKQKEEIVFLKDTINHQWKLLHELAKKR